MGRIQSIDVFRGLTIFVMIFVNDVAGVSGLPDWMYHADEDSNKMTFVDIVFPAFLIIVGMSIPLAINRRLDQGATTLEVAKHILIRTVGLIILGVFMVNAGEMNQEANLIPGSWWKVLLYLSVIAIWNQYPKDQGKTLSLTLRAVGIVILIALTFLYRKGEPGALIGMTLSWWGILGLIGWAYLIASMIYLIARESLVANIASMGILMMLALGLISLKMQHIALLSGWAGNQIGHIVHAVLVMAGILMTLLLQKGTYDHSGKAQLRWIITLAAICFIAGYFLKPLFGVSKIGATPSWALYSIAWCCLVFALIHWVVEIKKIGNWADFLKPAGMNPLLTYILPFIYYAVAGFGLWPAILNQGVPGVLRSVVFSLMMLWMSKLLIRWGINLRL